MNRRRFLKGGLLFFPTAVLAQSFVKTAAYRGALKPAGAGASFPVTAADFDGVTDYMHRGASFTGLADSKTGIFSCWFKFALAGDGGFLPLLYGNGQNRIYKQSDFVTCEWQDSGGTIISKVRTNTPVTSASGWVHVVASWDASDINKTKLYLNGADDTIASTQQNVNIEYTAPSDWGIPALPAGVIPAPLCICEMYFAAGQWLDLTNSANVQKFRSAGGHPVDLGATGATPTGSQPTLYLHVYDGTNAGSGGNLTAVSAPYSACADTP